MKKTMELTIVMGQMKKVIHFGLNHISTLEVLHIILLAIMAAKYRGACC